MKRVMVVVLGGALTTLLLGINETSWAVPIRSVSQSEPQREQVVRRLATMRRGSTVEIEWNDGTKFYAVVQDIGPDEITVLLERDGRTVTETIAIDDIRNIGEVSPQKVARGHKGLIAGAIVAGVLVALVGVCRANL